MNIFDIFVNMLINKLGIVFERCFSQSGIDFINHFSIADNKKLTEQFVFLHLRFDLGAIQIGLNRFIDFLTIGFDVIPIQVVDAEIVVLDFTQCQQNAGNNQRFVFILNAAIIALIFMQGFGVF